MRLSAGCSSSSSKCEVVYCAPSLMSKLSKNKNNVLQSSVSCCSQQVSNLLWFLCQGRSNWATRWLVVTCERIVPLHRSDRKRLSECSKQTKKNLPVLIPRFSYKIKRQWLASGNLPRFEFESSCFSRLDSMPTFLLLQSTRITVLMTNLIQIHNKDNILNVFNPYVPVSVRDWPCCTAFPTNVELSAVIIVIPWLSNHFNVASSLDTKFSQNTTYAWHIVYNIGAILWRHMPTWFLNFFVLL